MGTRKPTGWRALTGSSPYVVGRTDDEFMVVLNHTGDQVDLHIPIPRVRLSAAAKNFLAGENNPTAPTNTHAWIGASVHLNAAGTQLTVVVAGDATSRYTLAAVLAR